MSSLIPTCFALFTKHLLMFFFSEFQVPKMFFVVPQVGESGFLTHASLPPRPRASEVRGVHRGTFRQQELRSLDLAPVGRHVQRRVASGRLSPEARETRHGDDEKRQPNDEAFCNIFKLFRAKNIHKHTEQHKHKFQYIFLITLPLMKRSVIEVSKEK